MGAVVRIVFCGGFGAITGLVLYFSLFSIAKYKTEYQIICNFFRCFYDIRPFVLTVLLLPMTAIGRDLLLLCQASRDARKAGQLAVDAGDWLVRRAFYVGMIASLAMNPHIFDAFSKRPF
ncbi:hypothetical protein [Sulfitobacter mediterraneus]|uniref:hypothetical protein n=1 Tax=Sulfitobacter mediterraneus TaxID=83219 RepID=UPI002492CA19|nr:hypothetical protein [Sulfitobacter mediterraneus]